MSYKTIEVRNFRLNPVWEIQCRWIKTNYGFKHEAYIIKHGYTTLMQIKACYYNRTWETYEYKTVMNNVLVLLKDKINKGLYTRFYNRINKGNSFIHPKRR